MSTRFVAFAPLIEVTSAFLNGMQDATWTQRGTGAQNTLINTLDTPSPLIKQRTIAVAMDGANYSPPLFGGVVDQAIDWRDRQLLYQVEWDPVRDIRWGKADDNKQPLESMSGTCYTRTGGVSFDLDAKGRVGIYVDTTNGYLWFKKAPGYLRAVITCTAQLRERS